MAAAVVDLTAFKGKIRVSRGALQVEGNRIPLSQVDTILLGTQVRFGTGLVHHAHKFDVSVVFCDWKNEPVGALHTWSKNTLVGRRHRCQAELTEPRRKNAWKQLVKSKVASQAKTLELHGFNVQAEHVNGLARSVRSGDPQNIEAQAARIFWEALYGQYQFRRIPGAQDSLNALHNYGYTILRGRVLKAVVAAGLSPSLGVFHRGRSNAFCLVDDLIEPFRCIVDRAVLEVPNAAETELDRETKTHLVKNIYPGETLDTGFRPASAIDTLCASFAQYVEGDLQKLPVPEV